MHCRFLALCKRVWLRGSRTIDPNKRPHIVTVVTVMAMFKHQHNFTENEQDCKYINNDDGIHVGNYSTTAAVVIVLGMCAGKRVSNACFF